MKSGRIFWLVVGGLLALLAGGCYHEPPSLLTENQNRITYIIPEMHPPATQHAETRPVETRPGDAVAAEVTPAAPTLPYIIGADISSVQAEEARGTRFSDKGEEKDILAILKDHGFNYIRLRVFNDPTKAPPRGRPYSPEGFCDLPHAIAMARRVKAAGMGLLIDFHYSDSWADPAKQYTPAAWVNLPFEKVVSAMHDWTRDAVGQMKLAGAMPDIVQIGNEITPGMMVDQAGGGGSTRNWEHLAELLNAGASAVKEVDPRIYVMMHIDKGGDNAATRKWVDAALAHGVKFDILGESCYTRWQGPPESWKANFDDLAVRYPQLKFVIAEVAYEVKDANEVMRSLPEGKGLGTFVWEPTQNGNGQGLFSGGGRGGVVGGGGGIMGVSERRMSAYDELAKSLKE